MYNLHNLFARHQSGFEAIFLGKKIGGDLLKLYFGGERWQKKQKQTELDFLSH